MSNFFKMIKEFNINFTEKEISLIYQKVKDYPWDSVKDLDGWEHGTNKKYLKDKLISFNSKNHQNKKEKFVNLKLNKEINKFEINGSSYSGKASTDNIVGNWWNHKILQSSSQISPISGSIKEQVVTFIGKEKLELYGKSYDVEHFKLTSKDMSIPKNKRLNFDIWFDKKNALIMKVTYSRMGDWEYRVKNFE